MKTEKGEPEWKENLLLACQPFVSTRHYVGTGNVVRNRSDKDVALVEVALAIVAFEVEAVLRKGSAVGCNVVKAMGPCVGSLRCEVVEVGGAQSCLERCIVRISNALDLVNVAVIREA